MRKGYVLFLMLLTIITVSPLLMPSDALAQDVDIMCYVISNNPSTRIVQQTFGAIMSNGAPVGNTYYNCNQPMPYVVPADRWLCVTDVTASPYIHPLKAVGGDGAFFEIVHAHPEANHNYHGFLVPPTVTGAYPMAFPGGHVIQQTVYNATGARMFTRTRIAGYLGGASSLPAAEACR